ncbi:DUF3343 domain-containing protein [Ruminococcaceae bacterium OttesenSCG-928-I18]|nr:DUF3343 domain-containing protein [Ruminococcaceae bacterium OttesenSCG-928-I18]
MTDTYVATFFSHYDAVRFSKNAQDMGIRVKLMPVPRKVSSSCGTGAVFETDQTDYASFAQEGVDKIYLFREETYTLVFETE